MLEKLIEQDDGTFIDDEACSWESKEDYLCIGILPSCGCGDPGSIGKYVKEMFLKFVSQPNITKDISTFPAYEDLPAMFFLCWADHEKYIEHGTTIRCSWMTEKGMELLKDLESIGI